MASQTLSEFALHVRAVLGFPIPAGRVPLLGPAASHVVLGTAAGDAPRYAGVAEALAVDPEVSVRLFGKPDMRPGRRLGVALARAEDVGHARALARQAAEAITIV